MIALVPIQARKKADIQVDMVGLRTCIGAQGVIVQLQNVGHLGADLLDLDHLPLAKGRWQLAQRSGDLGFSLTVKSVQSPSCANEKQTKNWTPQTELGKNVVDGKVTSIDEIFKQGKKIMEPEIVDLLLPNLDHELVLIGGSPGKGGAIRRTPAKRTAKMHKSGRKYKMTAFAIIGNRNGYVGVGEGQATGSGAFRTAIEKAINDSKLNIIPVRRGCGSWECECASPHSLPTEIEGKEGSVRVVLKPAPRGVGLVVSDEVKKFMELAGVEDCWAKTFGETRTRVNLIRAIYNAFKNLNQLKIDESFKEKSGTVIGEK